jgi:hypothetical protein
MKKLIIILSILFISVFINCMRAKIIEEKAKVIKIERTSCCNSKYIYTISVGDGNQLILYSNTEYKIGDNVFLKENVKE